MEVSEKPLMITSLNPVDDVVVQRECFDRWKEVGFEVFSVNAPMEARRLRENGIADDAVITLRDMPIGEWFFRGARPKIDSMLQIVANRFPLRDIIICKPGVYPAIRDESIVDFFGEIADIVGLTSELSAGFGAYRFTDCTPNRTDLAALFIRAQQVESLSKKICWEGRREGAFLPSSSWVERFARQIRCQGMKGSILDSGVLIERLVDKPLDCVDFFVQCTFGVRMRPRFPGADREWTEDDDYRLLLDEECCRNAETSDQIRMVFFSHDHYEPHPKDSIERVAEIVSDLGAVAPDLTGGLNMSNITRALGVGGGQSGNMARLSSVFATSHSHYQNFSQTLLVIALQLRLNEQSHETPSRQSPIVSRYELIQVLERFVKSVSPEYRVRVAQIFGYELIKRRRLDKWLLKCLIVACENERERALIKDICEVARRQENVTSAD